jgi:hypothetical protein
MKRLSIEVSDCLHRQVKLAAVLQGQTLSSLVIALLIAYLEQQVSSPYAMRAIDSQGSSIACTVHDDGVSS